MPVRERPTDAASRRARQLHLMIGADLRGARRMAGISQDKLGAAVGLSGSEVGRIERGEAPWLTVTQAARLLKVVGLDLWAKTYPTGPPLRDAGHLRLLADFEKRLPPTLKCRREWPIPYDRDRRALDLKIDGLPKRTAVEAETGLHDLQALEREINLKRRDADIERMILLIRGTKRNREAVRAADALRRAFPASTRTVLSALSRGGDPGSDGIVIL
jgi:transcriptional regulator with XRE-family HTH domain